MLGVMDERAREGRRTIDRPAGDDVTRQQGVELVAVLRGVAARLDAILEQPGEPRTGVAASDTEAVEAWSAVMTRRQTATDPSARRAALATTVLRIGADGSMDVVDNESADLESAVDEDGDAPVASDPGSGESRPSAANVAGATVADSGARDVVQSDVDSRLRIARERLGQRRAAVTVEDRTMRVPSGRRFDGRTAVKRLLLAIAIVGTSAAVAVLLT